MESDRNELIALVCILRNTTRIVKVAPFVYSGLYILCMIAYLFANYEFCFVLDLCFTTSPATVVLLLLLSKYLKLCKWHKLECALPMLPIVPILVDRYCFTFSTMAAYSNVTIIILLSILSLINAYHVFIKPH
jgi:hypothetical protein